MTAYNYHPDSSYHRTVLVIAHNFRSCGRQRIIQDSDTDRQTQTDRQTDRHVVTVIHTCYRGPEFSRDETRLATDTLSDTDRQTDRHIATIIHTCYRDPEFSRDETRLATDTLFLPLAWAYNSWWMTFLRLSGIVFWYAHMHTNTHTSRYICMYMCVCIWDANFRVCMSLCMFMRMWT